MRKILSIFIALLLCLNMQAEEHLKFMGIPLDGTINQFHAKLTAKGMVSDVTLNKKLDVGCRAFKGSFSGEKAQIYVYYDEYSKIVYRAKAVITSTEESISEYNYNHFINMLSDKYSYAESDKGRQNGYETTSFLVPNLNEAATYKYMGVIAVYRDSYFSFSYSVHVDYSDTINKVKHENRNMDDL